uniref:CB1 cannabinoid receptor-interacting protein 1 n=1 Tax=Meloidogyne floridensis TaxID=298350 RepID=A0A915NLD3_9BILA
MQRSNSITRENGGSNLHVGIVNNDPRQRKFSISACRRHSIELNENQFMLIIMFSNAETNERISYKQDGSRFGASQLTLKFATNSLYKIFVKARPAQDFVTLNIGGSELKLIQVDADFGEYAAVWVCLVNTDKQLYCIEHFRQDTNKKWDSTGYSIHSRGRKFYRKFEKYLELL